MNFVSCYQLQDNRVSEVVDKSTIIRLLIIHNPLVVLEHQYAHITFAVRSCGELEGVNPFDWCSEETYRVRREPENK